MFAKRGLAGGKKAVFFVNLGRKKQAAIKNGDVRGPTYLFQYQK